MYNLSHFDAFWWLIFYIVVLYQFNRAALACKLLIFYFLRAPKTALYQSLLVIL